MAKALEVYKCGICGNLVEVLHGGAGELVCCGQPMALQAEKTEDTGYEKHLPVLAAAAGGVKVSVGSTRHPMEGKHYIQWIEVVLADKVLRHNLKAGDLPEAEFNVPAEAVAYVRSYCNLHGLWRTERK